MKRLGPVDRMTSLAVSPEAAVQCPAISNIGSKSATSEETEVWTSVSLKPFGLTVRLKALVRGW